RGCADRLVTCAFTAGGAPLSRWGRGGRIGHAAAGGPPQCEPAGHPHGEHPGFRRRRPDGGQRGPGEHHQHASASDRRPLLRLLHRRPAARHHSAPYTVPPSQFTACASGTAANPATPADVPSVSPHHAPNFSVDPCRDIRTRATVTAVRTRAAAPPGRRTGREAA